MEWANDRATNNYLRILIVKTVIYQFFKLRLYAINTQPVTLSSDTELEGATVYLKHSSLLTLIVVV